MSKLIEKNNSVVFRLDGAFLIGNHYLVTPYVRDDGKNSYFGDFRFTDSTAVKKALQEAVAFLRRKNPAVQDTIFGGQYPKWEENQYGTRLRVNNRVKFYNSPTSKTEIPENELNNYLYALEVHLTPTKNNEIYMRVARAIVLRETETEYENSLFDDLMKEEEDMFANLPNIEISEDDLPF